MTPSTAARPLVRSIGLPRATAMVVGTIIGASIFVQPSEISRHVPDVAGILLVWLVAGLLTFFGALVCAELASAFPRTGGVYVFLKETYSPAAGFLWGWAMFWSMHSGIIAAIAVVVARYIGFFVPLGDVGVRVVAILAILILSAVNYAGVRQGSAVQTFFTIVKVLAIGVMLVLVFALAPGHAAEPAAVTSRGSIHEFALALVGGLFAYGGWHMVTYAAEETRSPEKTIPRALMIGVTIVTFCYLALNAAYIYVLPLKQVIGSTRIATDVAAALVGTRSAGAVSILVIVSAFGALGGVILAGPRVYFAMAEDGLLFRWLRAVHPRFHTPHRAIAAQAVWSSVLVATGTYRSLFTAVVYTEWTFFGLMTAGLFLLRRRPGYAPAYRTWGYPIVPLLFVAATVIIVINQVVADPASSAMGFLLVAAGLPVYYFWARRGAKGAINSAGH
ncbi:MAG TPA: amino acid permease [Thermoanaerobaculia bacterium]|nr:amino acid permease [Thermoanaerobaculia bacterium]